MNSEKRLLASPRLPTCMYVSTSVCISAAPTGRSFVTFDIQDFYEDMSTTPNLVKIGQLYWAL